MSLNRSFHGHYMYLRTLYRSLKVTAGKKKCGLYTGFHGICSKLVQWNLVIKRSDITKPFYNKVILLVPALYIS